MEQTTRACLTKSPAMVHTATRVSHRLPVVKKRLVLVVVRDNGIEVGGD